MTRASCVMLACPSARGGGGQALATLEVQKATGQSFGVAGRRAGLLGAWLKIAALGGRLGASVG